MILEMSVATIDLLMGVNPCVDRGTSPYFLKWRARPVFSPYFFGVDISVLMHTIFIGRLEQFLLNLVS